MISKSDIIILVLASSALAAGVYRWHQNTQDVSAITIPASNRVTVDAAVQPANSGAGQTVSAQNTQLNTDVVVASTDNNTDLNAGNTGTVVVQTLPDAEVVPEIVVQGSTQNNFSMGSHVVVSGDYLGKIARQYGTDVQTLQELNGINDTVIHIGQEIFYPL